jgi:hypothetical protein
LENTVVPWIVWWAVWESSVELSARRYASVALAWVRASAGERRVVLYHDQEQDRAWEVGKDEDEDMDMVTVQGSRPHLAHSSRSFHIVAEASARLWNSDLVCAMRWSASSRETVEQRFAGSEAGPA